MNTRLLFNISAVIEVVTGIAMLFAPALVIGWLLGDDLGQTGIAVSRVLGIGLVSVGISTWETAEQIVCRAPRLGICTYNIGVAILLSVLGTKDGMNGILLWPAVGSHGLIGAAMLWVILPGTRSS